MLPDGNPQHQRIKLPDGRQPERYVKGEKRTLLEIRMPLGHFFLSYAPRLFQRAHDSLA